MVRITPLVSVIIPTYNCAQFIVTALESIFAQTFNNYEIIVIDDGSTDETLRVLKPFEHKIQLIRQCNSGVAAARNAGIDAAKGELIAFLDADDVFFPDKLEKQVALFQQQASLDIVISGWQIIDAAGELISQVTPWKTRPVLSLECVILNKPARPSATMVRRQVFNRVGCFNTTLTSGEDLDWLLRVMTAGYDASWLKDVLVGYRQHKDSLMTKGEQLLADTERVMQCFFARSDLPPDILQLQQQERYQSWAWLAARMYYDGHFPEAANCLEQALFYAERKDFRLVSDWMHVFKGYAAEYGHHFDAYDLTNTAFWKWLTAQVITPWTVERAELQTLAKAASFQTADSPELTSVLLYSDDPGVGGVSQCNHAIVCHLQMQGYEVSHACFQQDTPLSQKEVSLGVQLIDLGYHSTQDPGRSRLDIQGAKRLFKKHRPRLIIFSDGWPFSNLAAKQAAIDLGIPFVIVLGFIEPSCVGFDRQEGVDYQKLATIQYMSAREVIAVSKNNLQLLKELFALPESVGRVIYNGRPREFFATSERAVGAHLRQEFKIPPDGVICFTSGRLEPVKGYQHQIEAMRQLKQTVVWEKLWFVWAGAGAEALSSSNEDELRATIADLGVADRVIFLGQRWDIPDWLEASDIFVLTSEAEGMPLSVMEAMAKGLPVVATAVSGVPEELGETGQLLSDPVRNAEATINELAQTLKVWATSKETRLAVGIAGKQRASNLFQQEQMLAQYEEVVVHAFATDFVDARLANQPLKAEEIWQIRNSFRYASWVWTAWSRYMAEDFAGMDKALERAMQSSCIPKSWPILEWGKWFARFCKEQQVAFEPKQLAQSKVWKRLQVSVSKPKRK